MEESLRMFESLGFKVAVYKPETCILYVRDKEIEATPKNFVTKEYVWFIVKSPDDDDNFKQKIHVADEYGNSYYIGLDLLNAINQQVKDLGWI